MPFPLFEQCKYGRQVLRTVWQFLVWILPLWSFHYEWVGLEHEVLVLYSSIVMERLCSALTYRAGAEVKLLELQVYSSWFLLSPAVMICREQKNKMTDTGNKISFVLRLAGWGAPSSLRWTGLNGLVIIKMSWSGFKGISVHYKVLSYSLSVMMTKAEGVRASLFRLIPLLN